MRRNWWQWLTTGRRGGSLGPDYSGYIVLGFFGVVTMLVVVAIVAGLLGLGPGGEEESAAPAALPEPTIKTSGKPIFISAPGKPGITVQKHNAGYHDVYELVGGDGSHDVSQQRWQQVMDILGWGGGAILPKKRKMPAGASNGTTGKRSNPLGNTWTKSLETA